MGLRKGLVFGILGALLVGGAQAVGELVVQNAAAERDSTNLRVPAGSIGDRVVYQLFHRSDPAEELKPVPGSPRIWFEVLGTTQAFDRTGQVHETISVAENGFQISQGMGVANLEGSYNTTFLDVNRYSLANRDLVVRGDADATDEVYMFALERERTMNRLLFGPFDSSSLIQEPGYLGFRQALHQGETYSVGEDVDAWAKRRLGSELQLWNVADGGMLPWRMLQLSDLELQGTVGNPAMIGSSLALPIQLEGCVRFSKTEHTYPGFEGAILFNAFAPSPSRTCFQLTEWVTADIGYPLRLETRLTATPVPGSSFNESRNVEAVLVLADYIPGTLAIPWTNQGPAYRTADPTLERSPNPIQYPTDGASPLVGFRLDQALAAIEADLTLVNYKAWRAQQPTAQLIGFEMRASDSYAKLDVLYATPTGQAFVLFVERSNQDRLVVSEVGAFSSPPYDPADLPAAPVTIGAAARRWQENALAGTEEGPNFFSWGYGYWPEYVDCGPYYQTRCQRYQAQVYPYSHFLSFGRGYGTIHPGNSRLWTTSPLEDWRFSVVTVDPGTGNTAQASDWNLEGARDVAVPPTALAANPSEAKTAPISAPATTPDFTDSALLTAGLIALVMIGYFWPLLKGAAAHGLLLIPGYAKTEKSQLLKHKVRENLHLAIRAEPGITAPELQKLTGAAWTPTVYHLRLLEKNKLISSMIDGRHRRYFPVDSVNAIDRGRIAAMQNARTRAIYDVVREQPGLDGGELASRIGVSRPAVYFHVERLEHLGMLGRERVGRHVRYFATQAMARYDPSTAVEVS